MASGSFVFGLLFLAAAQAFVQTGKEYEYNVVGQAGAGTYDYVPHMSGIVYKFKVRLQAESDTSIKGEISDVMHSQYVGRQSDDYDQLEFHAEGSKLSFGITLENGIFKSLALPPGLPLEKKNVIKAFASTFQISGQHIEAGHLAFKSPEQTIHGTCDVSYVVTPDTIYKSINLDSDCKDRAVRRVDDVRGFDCDHENKDKADGLVSTSNVIYTYEKEGAGHKITKIIKNGAFVSQMFETEGVSHIAMANITMDLVSTKDSPGDIEVGSESTNTLKHEFADAEYKWNKDRDLKAAEPVLATMGPAFIGDDQGALKKSFMKLLTQQKDILGNHETSEEKITQAHRMGLETLRLPLMAMDYSTLLALHDELHSDKSADGVMLCNIFTELLGSTGTSASAMVVLDLIKGKKFDNTRDAARTLTSIPFHIRRPSAKLVGEYESLLDSDQESIVKMAIQLTFGHLVRITCERAGQPFSDQQKECFQDLGAKWNKHFFDKFKASNSREMRNLYLSTILNIRYGGQMEMLKPMIYGEMEGATSEERSLAVYAAAWDAAVHKKTGEFFLPVYANRKNDHSVRITALNLIMNGKPSMTDLSRIVAVLKTETDYEVINMVFSSLEAKASSISPCDRETSELAGFFLKYLKQFSKYEIDWGFGVSKTYIRQFNQRKYGYGGSYKFQTIGSHQSTTPLTICMGVGSYVHHNYKNDVFHVQLMVQGVAKGLIRRFKTMDAATWKTEDLAAILNNEMSIKERPDQPIRANVLVALKGTIVICRSYDDSDSSGEGGKFGSFLEKLKSLGSAYSINHQRVFQVGQITVEQPTDSGIAALYTSSLTAMVNIKADVKRGSQRGLMYREIDYHWDSFVQSRSGMLVVLPGSKKLHSVTQDRIYKTHFPRKVVIGINPITKELKLRISRAEYDHPTMFMMHSRTSVSVASTTLGKKVDEDLKKNCPSCESMVVVSAGEGAEKSRTIVDRESEKYGYRVKAEYFDCEMNIMRANTMSRAIVAFAPYNKNPKTAWNSISMGLRQIRAFLLYFPRAEKCGIVAMYSQSQNNPVREIELSVAVSKKPNGERLFHKGSKMKVVATLKAKGDQTRAYRMTLTKESTPGDLINKIKVKIDRAAVAALGIKPYVICMGYENLYPPFDNEMFNVEMDKPLTMTGKALLQYGEGTSCSGGQGEITAKFEYSTTQEARESLKKKYYYQQCMKLKQTEAWKMREFLPMSKACQLTLFDAATARRYKYDIKFAKMTDRMKMIVANVRGIIRAVMLQVFDMETIESDIGPFLKVDATFKDSDSLVDIIFETSRGTNKISDYPLRFNWSKRLRNLKFSKMTTRLNDMGILKPCIATSTYVHTMDNVTYDVSAPDCWTLVSGHCGPSPSYAVFAKKRSGSNLSPLAIKAYIGGHEVRLDGDGAGSVTVNGNGVSVSDTIEHIHKVNNVELFKITKWGTVYNIYSSMRVWISYDGNFINVVAAPSVAGQHCGLCGNYNRNKYDETTGKDGVSLTGYSQMADEWKWKC